MNRTIRARLLVCLVAAASLPGCVKAPPVLNPTSIPAPAIPAPPALSDASQFGYLRAHQLVRLAERVGAGALVNMAAGRAGVDLRSLDPEKPLVIVVGDPGLGGGLERLPITGVLPISPGGAMAQKLAALLKPENVTAFGSGVGVALNSPPVDASTPAGKLLLDLSSAPLAADVELYLRISSLMVRYGDNVRRGLAQVEAEMKKESGTNGLDEGVIAAYVDWMRGVVDNLDSVSVGLGAGDNAIGLSTIQQDKSAAGARLPSTAESMADLAQFVPPADFRVEAGGKNMAKWLDFTLKFYQPLFKDDPAGFAELRAAMSVMARGRMQGAVGLSIAPEGLFTGSMVMLVEEAGARFDAGRRLIAVMSQPAFRAAYARSGFDMTITSQQNARQVEGWPVDHVVYDIRLNENAKTRELERFFRKPIAVDMMRIGSYLVYQFNGTPESLEKMVRELLSGKGPYPALAARTDHPAGGFFYADIDVARLLESIRAIAREDKRDEVPHLDPTMPRVTSFGYDAGPASWYRLSVPTRLVDAIRDIVGRAGSGASNPTKGGGPYLPQPKD